MTTASAAKKFCTINMVSFFLRKILPAQISRFLGQTVETSVGLKPFFRSENLLVLCSTVNLNSLNCQIGSKQPQP